eukprot:719022_1
MEQLILRGCSLHNTEWIIGLVVFTGIESKIILNNKEQVFKRSSLDLLMDKMIITIFCIELFICLVALFVNYYYYGTGADELWYMNNMEMEGGEAGSTFTQFFTFFILMSNFVPISLYVCLEVNKYFQSTFINTDVDMHDEETDTCAVARTATLTEELGMIASEVAKEVRAQAEAAE